MSILSKNQQRVLKVLSEVGLLKDNFYFGGGTVLSEFYLQHRYSEDFDFHTSQQNVIPLAVNEIEVLFKKNTFLYEVKRQFQTFAELFVRFHDESIKIDLAMDSPFRLKPVVYNEQYGINIENQTDLCCNKLSALFDRFAAKDFVDIYFIDKEIIKIKELLKQAQIKHIGLDAYWLSRSFYRVSDLTVLPRMIKSVTIQELKQFFLNEAKVLINE